MGKRKKILLAFAVVALPATLAVLYVVSERTGRIVEAPHQTIVQEGRDTDRDGLSNAEELTRGLNPDNFDTDNDGLSDWREVVKLGTNPLAIDTDGDGRADGTEIRKGTNPLVAE